MTQGSKVICINDEVDPDTRSLYVSWPKKDNTYIVRDVFLGEFNIATGVDTRVGITLKGLHNPIANNGKEVGRERGFNQDRFREIEPPPPKTKSEKEDEGVGVEEEELVEV